MQGSDLRTLREKRGFRAFELAKRLDIAPATLSRFERGHRPIPKTVEYAARYLCEETAGQRLITALKEAIDYAGGNHGGAVRHEVRVGWNDGQADQG